MVIGGERVAPMSTTRYVLRRGALVLDLHTVAASEGDNMVATETTDATQATVFWTDLTSSERRVGAAIAQGWTNAEIVRRLALSPRTVENRVSAIYEKLPSVPGTDRRVQTVLLIRTLAGS